MRIVTRPDFDGVVCAVLIYEAMEIDGPVFWTEPNEMQHGRVPIEKGDIIANLPFHPACSMWFDHHFTNQQADAVPGLFRIAPSAGGLVWEHFRETLGNRFDELVAACDKIDAADLTREEVLRPEDHPYVLLSMTLKNRDETDPPYWDHVTELLRKLSIGEVLEDPLVADRCAAVVTENRAWETILKENTTLDGGVSVVDLRPFDVAPSGNRFLVYSMFDDAHVSVKIRYKDETKERLVVSVGRSIFNETCLVNVGHLLTRFGGGGHPGAGACSFASSLADEYLPEIVRVLKENRAGDVA